MIRRLLVLIGFVIILFNVLLIVWMSSTLKKTVEREDIEKITTMVDAHALAIENQVECLYKEIDFYVNADIMQTGDFDEIKEWLNAHGHVRSPDFDYILFSGPDGSAFSDIGTTTNIKGRTYHSDIFQGKDKTVDNPVISKTTGQPVIHITRAVKRNGRTFALVCGVVNLNSLISSVEQIKIGKEGYAWMLASDGMVISHPVKEYVMEKNFITGLSDEHTDMADVAARIAAGEAGNAWIAGLKKSRDCIIFHGVAGTPWGLAVSIPDSQLFELSTVMSNQMVVGTIIIVVVLMLITGTVVFFTIRPLKTVVTTIDDIANGDADLTRRIETKSRNEIGQVVTGFNSFVSKLQTIVTQVKKSKDVLGTAGSDLEASTVDTTASITQILANIDSVRSQIENQSHSVHETAGAVNEIASNIESLETMIDRQSTGVSAASSAVEEMIGNIGSVNNSMEKMSASFEELTSSAQKGVQIQSDVNEKIEQIKSLSETLQEANTAIAAIAAQTNLLAMNAAIEAAHAGDAGKGFSVVADEIRKLSETSTSQSKTIGVQLKNIQDSITSVVGASEQSTQAFNTVTEKITETDQIVRQIKAAMDEQNEGSKQISQALHTMNDSSLEVKAASHEMSEGNKAILSEVRNLQDATSVMESSMQEMSSGAKKINETGSALRDIAQHLKNAIDDIGKEIDQFKV
ncbi:MAG: HAMP domain-containing protein [Treponema sp.]|nr:HAMP domain-containing protein [Treponema sp.]